MTLTLINLGLNRSAQSSIEPNGALEVAAVFHELEALWGRTWRGHIYRSDTEATLVIAVPAKVSHATLLRLAKTFDQDAVAAYNVGTNEGMLSGPKAALWGPFNPEYFIHTNGRRLSEMFVH